MKIIYYYDDPPELFSKSIFLAGPSPRTKEVQSWRPDALRILSAKGYDGVVFVPEQKPGDDQTRYDWSQAPQWEHKMLDMSDIVLFWVPRDVTLSSDSALDLSNQLAGRTEADIYYYLTNQPYKPELKLPGFTTNVELGHWISSGRAMLGHPPKAPHTGYLDFMADKFRVPILPTLENLIDKSLESIGTGALRNGGEREIPLFLWDTHSFQLWYQSHKRIGNYLNGAKIYWTFRVGKNKEKIFYWAIHPDIHIISEGRDKTNETVLSRFDISTVVMYKREPDILDSKIVLVREFRSPARNYSGFVWELPGGSSPDSTDPLQTIAQETLEEVGLTIDQSRFKLIQSRQMAATMSAHCATLYSVELTDNELAELKNQKGIPHGADYPDNPTGERAYTEVVTLKEILYNNLADWPNVGMILLMLLEKEEKK